MKSFVSKFDNLQQVLRLTDMIRFPFFRLNIGEIRWFSSTNSATTGSPSIGNFDHSSAINSPAYSKFWGSNSSLIALLLLCRWVPKWYCERITPFNSFTAQKMKFSIEDLFSKCDQIRRKLQIWSRLLKKFLKKKFIFCAVIAQINHTLFHSIESFTSRCIGGDKKKHQDRDQQNFQLYN